MGDILVLCMYHNTETGIVSFIVTPHADTHTRTQGGGDISVLVQEMCLLLRAVTTVMQVLCYINQMSPGVMTVHETSPSDRCHQDS